MLTLYAATGSCSRASHIALEESGLAYEVRLVDFARAEQREAAYLAINPKGRVPALATDQGVLTDVPAAELRRLLANSHAPYSGVHVSAAVECEDGAVHYGVNVENAAYPEGVCAEASAISAAVTNGRKSIRRVWVASRSEEHTSELQSH